MSQNDVAVTHESYLELHRQGEGTEKTQMLEWLTIARIDSTKPLPKKDGTLVIDVPISDMKRWGLITDSHISQAISRLHKQVSKLLVSAQIDGKYHSIVAFPMLVHDSRKDVVTVSIMAPLAPYLTELQKNFSQFKLQVLFGELSGMWTRKIYLILANHYPKDHPFEIDYEELKKRLGIDKRYPLYANFKKKVLLPSLKEINDPQKGCDIKVEYEELKKGRRVSSLVFRITENYPRQESLGISPATSNLTAQTHALLDEIKWTSHQKFFFEDLSEKVEPKIIEKALQTCIDENDIFRNSKGFAGRIRNTFMQTMESVMQTQKLQEKEKSKAAEKREKQAEIEKAKLRTEELADKYILENKDTLYSQLTAMEKQFWTVDDVPDSALRPYALEALKMKPNG